MGLPVTVYRWDDAGAPQFGASPKPSDVLSILKACLVNGYGAKQPLGWSVAFEDAVTYAIMFRNSPTDGTGGYLKVSAELGLNTYGTEISLKASSGASSLSSQINASFIQTFKCSIYDTHWVLIGTSRGFYFQILDGTTLKSVPTNANSNNTLWFAGDINSYYANDAGAFTTICNLRVGDDVSSHYSESMSELQLGSALCALYDADGGTNKQNYECVNALLTDTYSNISGYASDESLINLFTVPQIGTLSAYKDRFGVPVTKSNIAPWIRGELPGLVLSSISTNVSTNWPVLLDIGGNQHMGMPSRVAHQVYINLVTWYE
ncbi:hypothetical protein [Shewanella frigidimarina]|jgi:hypothetical protein|uniref:Uncharacterized protein n=1 Tax=Shewanella frigidimarina (strain NCIMB 400) TaxID=318167 RepID=Q083M7_SHEFN|nr:hypothetical protein [Shewanella frigidimarina]ABI71538.1 hypothetical protein Sfri_1687 [Shewanella frigidimarina NCIMB 400]